MNHKKFMLSFDQMVAKTSLALVSNAVLAVAVGLLVWDKVTEEPIVQVVPPTLTAEAKVGASSADAEYLMSWGLYFASMTGNVTPKNVIFVADSISAFIDPGIYPEVRKQLFALSADPTFNQRGGSVSFEAQDISYDAPSNKVFVTGEQVSRTTAGEQQRTSYVYEIEIEIRARRPVITAVDHYKGAPRTAKWLKNEGRRSSRARENDEGLNNGSGATPWFDEDARFSTSTESESTGK